MAFCSPPPSTSSPLFVAEYFLQLIAASGASGGQPDLARVIYDAAHQRLGAAGAQRMREREAALDFGILA